MLTNDVAIKIVEYIEENDLRAGTRLPSIREFASLLDCNPSVVRTGLITLSALGVIALHPRAGAFVRQLGSSELDVIFELFFRLGMLGKRPDTSNLYSVKTMLDKEIIQTAIKYRTDADLLDLEENLERQSGLVEDCPAFVRADEDFHLRLAQIVRNPIIVYMLEAVQVMIRPYRHENLTPDICRESYASHVQIFKAIEAKDEEKAAEIAVLHTLPRLKRLAARNEAQKAAQPAGATPEAATGAGAEAGGSAGTRS